jgi:hypothetical protein
MTWWRRHKDLFDKTNIISWVHPKESKIPHKKWTYKLWDSCLHDVDHIICQIFNLEYYQYNNQKKKPYDSWYQFNSSFILHRLLHMILKTLPHWLNFIDLSFFALHGSCLNFAIHVLCKTKSFNMFHKLSLGFEPTNVT